MAKLTTVTIAKNEEQHITRALESVRGLADEILAVVDMESTDRTADIAGRLATRVLRRVWDGFGAQKNFALDAATGDWVLFVDADEEVTPELADEIRQTLASATNPVPAVYFLRIVTEFLGRPLRHMWGTNPRLLRRGAVRWDNREVHEQVMRTNDSVVKVGDPDVGLLTKPLWHPSHYATLRAYLEKRASYTTRDAEQMLQTGRDRQERPIGDPTTSLGSRLRFLFERALKQGIRLCMKKRGFLDGWQGLLWIWLSVQYEYIVARKYLALRRAQS